MAESIDEMNEIDDNYFMNEAIDAHAPEILHKLI